MSQASVFLSHHWHRLMGEEIWRFLKNECSATDWNWMTEFLVYQCFLVQLPLFKKCQITTETSEIIHFCSQCWASPGCCDIHGSTAVLCQAAYFWVAGMRGRQSMHEQYVLWKVTHGFHFFAPKWMYLLTSFFHGHFELCLHSFIPSRVSELNKCAIG